MVHVTFVQSTGERRTVDAAPGVSVMEAALANQVPEVESDCGGLCTCACCHVYVDDDWTEKLSPPSKQETLMLGLMLDRRPTSRLSCQLKLSDALDGLIVWTVKS